MTAALFVLLRLLVTDADAEALRRTATEPVALELAAENLAAARVAGAVFGIDPDLLLSISWHEGHWRADAVTPEHDGLVSCGAMTPEPIAHCEPQTVLDGYLAGARHLRTWMNATPDLRTGLLGYASGYRGIHACKLGPVLRSTGGHDDLCRIPDVFLWRRDQIVSERRRALS